MTAKLNRLRRDDTGISSVEYAMLLSLIGAGLLLAITTLGSNTATRMNEAAALIQ